MKDAIEQSIRIATTIEAVWEALTTIDGIRSWFGDEVELDLRSGGEARFGWSEYESSSHAIVEVVDRPFRFSYRWAAKGTEDVRTGPSTLVEFTLEADDRGTTVTVRESGFASLPTEIAESNLAENTSGWTAEMEDLRAYLSGVTTG
jgi:uncharacterized protein YndB with AHSA1/START domain